MAGGRSLGVIGVKSYSSSDVYDISHQEVLCTIAAQAAVAIQNARLYARTDETLARRVRELDSILATTQEGILLVDMNYRVVAANQSFADLTGLDLTDVTRVPLISTAAKIEPFTLVELLGENPAELREDCLAILEGSDPLRKRVFAGVQPSQRAIERTLTPVRNSKGEVTSWLLVFHDLTEQRELERLREEMTSMLIHDLRAPLSNLQGHLYLIEEDIQLGKLERTTQLLASAQRSNERVLRMANTLLDIQRFEGGQIPLQRQPLCVRTILEEAATQFASLAEMQQISIEVNAQPDLPALSVDAEHFGRVLTNLLDNAFKFTPDRGHISLWARQAAATDSPSMLIGVSDSGPGVPTEEHDWLFQKFRSTASPKGRRGSGLGLVYCKLAVEAHGGRIWVESEAGQGSSFIIQLPIL